MAKDWEFGGRPIVHDVGKRSGRRFAFQITCQGDDVLERFASDTEKAVSSSMDSLKSSKHGSRLGEARIDSVKIHRHCAEEHVETEWQTQVAVDNKILSFTATVGVGTVSAACQLRFNVFQFEGLLIVESQRRWGSAIEEMLMLKYMNDGLVK